MEQNYLVLDLQYPWNGTVEHLHPAVLFGKEGLVLVDCGYPGSLSQLEAQLQASGLSAAQLRVLVLTHQDDDHMGAAAELKEKYPHIRIAASEIEAPYISGEQKNLRLQQAEELQVHLPQAEQAWGEAFCDRLRRVRPVEVDTLLHPGDTFDWSGGCRILATPGHTPGHISLWLTGQDVMITGDAAVTEQDRLLIANPQFCLDLKQAELSLEKIKGSSRCICYHGGVFHC